MFCRRRSIASVVLKEALCGPTDVAHQAPLSTGFPGQHLEWAAFPFSRGSS